MANSRLPSPFSLLVILLIVFSDAFILPSAMDCNGSDRTCCSPEDPGAARQPTRAIQVSNWLPATNCYAWDSGVICSETGCVYLVALFQLDTMPGLYGTIPSSFSKLSHLELLDITGTLITGPFLEFLVN
ncbi:hypothetical protein PR202_ga21442 [Eleusine coracana subsp. coracana]|uniref:Leucine-rich repeat-containing N-terminal plant-type domain-containing protein n=1 Tax=Eleusine coracana subsp. coracana TaxID=191504 RepID=A0AAV5D123_ELECO|nr:hypothetical protein PR202_ga21442 [Eleusine coracana subsp. coracana]